MTINYQQLRNVTAREMITALIHDGFVLDRSTGSHQHYRHPDGRRVKVAFHRPGATLPRKTLK